MIEMICEGDIDDGGVLQCSVAESEIPARLLGASNGCPAGSIGPQRLEASTEDE